MNFTICSVLLAGSALLVRCGDPLKCDADTAQEVRIAAGEKIKEALVSENYPNNYPNNACQRWNIMADENQVHFLLIFGGHKSFLWGHCYPCFGFLLISPLVSKPEWAALLALGTGTYVTCSLRLISDAKPTNRLVVSMAAELSTN